jgi:single-stranded-DNA-specific exonuclease
MKRYMHWQVQSCDRDKARALAEELHRSPVLTAILLHRGLDTADAMREFLYGKREPYYDPFLMKDLKKAAERVWQAVDRGESVTIFGDYDVDGITASSTLYLYLKERGAKVRTYIPRRQGEGYGLNSEALETLYREGTTLVVTVDCGISGAKEVREAPAGMDIIITDHHRPPEELPPAYAVVNPNQRDCPYPFKGLSGVGVAFKLCQALEKLKHPEAPLWEGHTELAALGTVADIVPLLDENRTLVQRGLKAMETTDLVGLRKLMEVSGCPAEHITSENVGFILAPRLNAVGRLEHAQRAVELLTASDEEQAAAIAQELNQENARRQEISRTIFEEAEAMLAAQREIGPAIVLAKEGWHAGVIGIVASRLVDKYYRPVILLSLDGDKAKGSCRSIPPLDLYNAIANCRDDLIQFGGHSQAAGLTLETANVDRFREDFCRTVSERLKPEDFEAEINIDICWDPDEVLDLPLLHQLRELEPFGNGNPAPVFAMTGAVLHNPRAVGKEQNHLRFFTSHGDASYASIMWQGGPLLPAVANNVTADVAFLPKINVFRGEESVNLQVLSVRQDLTVFDFRHRGAERDDIVREFLRTEPQVTLFVNPGSTSADAFAGYGNLTVRTYGEKCGDEERVVLFYDLPEVPVFTADAFPLDDRSGRILALLYNWQEFESVQDRLDVEFPNRDHLSLAYRYIEKTLKSQAVCLVPQLLESARRDHVALTEKDLAIFEELDFFRAHGAELVPGTRERRSLDGSATYRAAQQEGMERRDGYYTCLRITRQRLDSLRRQR